MFLIFSLRSLKELELNIVKYIILLNLIYMRYFEKGMFNCIYVIYF